MCAFAIILIFIINREFFFLKEKRHKESKKVNRTTTVVAFMWANTWDETVEGNSSHVKVRWRCRRRMTAGNKYQKSCERKFVFWNCFYVRYNHIEWECFCVSSGCSYPPYVFTLSPLLSSQYWQCGFECFWYLAYFMVLFSRLNLIFLNLNKLKLSRDFTVYRLFTYAAVKEQRVRGKP